MVFPYKKALLGFAANANESITSLFKISETASEQLAKFVKTAANNLGVERSVGSINYEISIFKRKPSTFKKSQTSLLVLQRKN